MYKFGLEMKKFFTFKQKAVAFEAFIELFTNHQTYYYG